MGAIDGPHVTRTPTSSYNAPDYFSRHQQHDHAIQGNVDGKNNSMGFACGIFRSMHDARAFRCSTIFDRARHGDNLGQETVNVP